MLDETFQKTWVAGFVITQSAKQRENAQPAFPGNAGTCCDVFTWFVFDVEFNPLTSVGVDGSGNKLVLLHVAKSVTLTRLEDHAWRSNELTYDHSLRAIDDESPLLGHLGEIAHKHGLLFDFAGVPVHEPSSNENLIRVGVVFFLTFLFGKLGRSL